MLRHRAWIHVRYVLCLDGLAEPLPQRLVLLLQSFQLVRVLVYREQRRLRHALEREETCQCARIGPTENINNDIMFICIEQCVSS